MGRDGIYGFSEFGEISPDGLILGILEDSSSSLVMDE